MGDEVFLWNIQLQEWPCGKCGEFHMGRIQNVIFFKTCNAQADIDGAGLVVSRVFGCSVVTA